MTTYCEDCRRKVEARRRIGVGTLILALLTGFVWVVAIPFYSKRCPVCGIKTARSFRLE